ncbi:hypothetical protein E1A91_D08G026200v1 [Gossypium mustelinum]|uniref:Defensin-like protein n=4 Tax=Gossypium TaxID=3633 RepID=A0A5J5Q8S3_GOSBA|nr:hypothetical protein ES319_D08G025400v1 [Gossypium barbadense]TYG55987.1 hypothetical protein ES288_D08G026900v1 [Gossypium darwinii]TYH56543.1 hypothetical protein ES332_D08G026400v1 [Gossypium tomentosum]TYI67557.1 hypothetical protein E1A91_D08G026200v1 [Gossypium mustelinum]
MIKFSLLFYIFAILLILTTSAKVNGAQCEAELGICDDKCDSTCEASKNGKGKCEKLSPNEVGTCKCLYECGSNTDGNGKSRPENKKCSVGIGPCSVKCNDICCRFKCAFKYPGPLEGTGMCLNIIGLPSTNECICYFNC